MTARLRPRPARRDARKRRSASLSPRRKRHERGEGLVEHGASFDLATTLPPRPNRRCATPVAQRFVSAAPTEGIGTIRSNQEGPQAKYQPYDALRQKFWRVYLKQYDTDDNGTISHLELTSMLDSLGSTLSHETVDSFWWGPRARWRRVEELPELVGGGRSSVGRLLELAGDMVEGSCCSGGRPELGPGLGADWCAGETEKIGAAGDYVDEDTLLQLRNVGSRVRKSVTEGFQRTVSVPADPSTPTKRLPFTQTPSFISANDVMRDIFAAARAAKNKGTSSAPSSPQQRPKRTHGPDDADAEPEDADIDADELTLDEDDLSTGPMTAYGGGQGLVAVFYP
ncbi:hypothetical protein C2E23DRAFT_943035 [Lenzites betulinus]|nr:hypothetical protein C2E23DRAFT_943035 [Lenzites betulinus]